jgi:integrase
VPISSRALEAVRRWREVSVETPRLFPSGRKHLSRVRLFQIVRAACRRCRHRSDRLARTSCGHAFATHLLAGGADLRALPDPARSRGHRHHANLHPCRQRPAGRAGQPAPPALARPR